MYNCCLRQGLSQQAQGPTRGSNLLDLAITDLDSSTCAAEVLRSIADLSLVSVVVRLGLPRAISAKRRVWGDEEAAWSKARAERAQHEWR